MNLLFKIYYLMQLSKYFKIFITNNNGGCKTIYKMNENDNKSDSIIEINDHVDNVTIF